MAQSRTSFDEFLGAPLTALRILAWALLFYLKHPWLIVLSLVPMMLRILLVAVEGSAIRDVLLETLTETARIILLITIVAYGFGVAPRELAQTKVWRPKLQYVQRYCRQHLFLIAGLALCYGVIFFLLDKALGAAISTERAVSFYEFFGATLEPQRAQMAFILMIKNFVIIPWALIYMLRAIRAI